MEKWSTSFGRCLTSLLSTLNSISLIIVYSFYHFFGIVTASKCTLENTRFAAALAAKKPNMQGVAVARAYSLPIASASCDALTNVFSPFCREEFERVLKRGGYLVNVIPAEKHLWELKAAVYDHPYENKLNPIETEGFRFVEKIAVEKRITLPSQEDIAALMMMTPYFYRTSREGHARAEALSSIDLTASFYLLVYQKI